VFSGVEGKSAMAQNIRQLAATTGVGNHIIAVLDGRSATAQDGVDVLTQLRGWYNVNNNAVKVLTESAGTREGLTYALRTGQADVCSTWANDPVAVVTPSKTAAELGFTPSGSAGAGQQAQNDVTRARQIVDGMKNKNYQTKDPYIDPNSGHGTVQGLIEGLKYLATKTK
jgi:hypothetical protein